jgi:Zn2+/Cd2+-exporting ATPase
MENMYSKADDFHDNATADSGRSQEKSRPTESLINDRSRADMSSECQKKEHLYSRLSSDEIKPISPQKNSCCANSQHNEMKSAGCSGDLSNSKTSTNQTEIQHFCTVENVLDIIPVSLVEPSSIAGQIAKETLKLKEPSDSSKLSPDAATNQSKSCCKKDIQTTSCCKKNIQCGSIPTDQGDLECCCDGDDCCASVDVESCCDGDDCCADVATSKKRCKKDVQSGPMATSLGEVQSRCDYVPLATVTHKAPNIKEPTYPSVATKSDTHAILIDDGKTGPDTEIDNLCRLLCHSCDPLSLIPHTIQVSRFRVANLCCAGEEKIVRSCLEGMNGIENIAVNVVGRYIVIKHCAVMCCAPGDKIVEILNAKHLGASIQEAAGTDEGGVEKYDWIRIVHTFLVFLLFITGLILQFVSPHPWASVGVYLAATAVGIVPILRSSYITIIRKTVDIHILMTIAIAGAIAGKEYFDAALVVLLFISAELIESIAMMKVRQAISSSSTSMAKEAYLSDGTKIKIEDLKVGQVLAVRAGEMILGDGVVSKGEGVVDESALTGESLPIPKKRGDKVLSGTVAQNGFMEIEVTADFKDCTMNRLNQEVADVQADKGEYAKIVDQFSVYWTPGVIIGTAIFIVVGGAVTGDWNDYVLRGLVLLVLACPCAIVIAAPIPSICAIAVASKNGVLIRGSSVIERMGRVNAVALDKTGTLTKGFFKVGGVLSLSEDPNSDCDPMRLAAAIELKSAHPLANAIVAAHFGCVADMMDSDIPMLNVRKIVVSDGVGVSGWAESEPDFWQHVSIGNERLLKVNGGKVKASARQQQLMDSFNRESSGKVVLIVAIDDQLERIISLSDELRLEAHDFVESMQLMKMTVSMLTGDQELVAADVCREVGIPRSECNYRLLPREKMEWIEARQKGTTEQPKKGSSKVMMVGDGINDSIALTAADVGVAMGAGGSAMAVASADIILMTDNLLLLPAAVKMCQSACSITLQNFAFAIIVKVIAIILALVGHLEFWQAVLVDMGTLLFVLVNGIRPLLRGTFSSKSKTL